MKGAVEVGYGRSFEGVIDEGIRDMRDIRSAIGACESSRQQVRMKLALRSAKQGIIGN